MAKKWGMSEGAGIPAAKGRSPRANAILPDEQMIAAVVRNRGQKSGTHLAWVIYELSNGVALI